MSEERVSVAIVGGGAAGTLTALHWLRGASPRPLRAALIERRMPVGRGVAYATSLDTHRLNLPLSEMSAYADDPLHLWRYVQSQEPSAQPGDFLPRGRYGAYLEATLDAAIAEAPANRVLERIADEAVGLLPEGGLYRLRLASGRLLLAEQVVLAIGQFPPAALRVAAGEGPRPWFVEDPWRPEALAPLPAGAEALLVGTGLTATDVALALLDTAGAARVTLVSRKAQLPAPQYTGPGYPAWGDLLEGPETRRVAPLLRRVREELEAARSGGADWRAALDALKPEVPRLWANWPLVERRRFLRHVRRFWEAGRNRLPPDTAARVAALREAGRLVVVSARLSAVEARPEGGAVATLALRGGGEQHLPIARLVNCTGPDTLYRRIAHPLVLDAIGTGLARPEPLGLGLDVAPDGRLKDEDGDASRPLFTLGWPRQGQLWEATTVPSLREQARAIALQLLAR